MSARLLAEPGNTQAGSERHRHRRPIAALLSALSLCVGVAMAQTPTNVMPVADLVASGTMNDRYADALQAYERNHWPQAYAAFMVMATQGHTDAARVVLLMHRHGPRLYGQDFALTASQRALLAPLSAGTRSAKVPHAE